MLWNGSSISQGLRCELMEARPNTSSETTGLPTFLPTTMLFGPLSISFAPYVQSSRTLTKWLTPIAHWYANAAGWRKYGFKYDDLCKADLTFYCPGFRAHV